MSKIQPQRIQRKRTAGFNLQAESLALNGLPAIYVGRPTKWGNPYLIKTYGDPQLCLEDYEYHIERGLNDERLDMRLNLNELRGKNLACFCPLDSPCHADVLLRLIAETEQQS